MLLRWLLVAATASVLSATGLRAQPPSALPPAAWQPVGARVTWRGLSFIVPPGMRGTDRGDFYEMGGLGMRGRGGLCAILIGERPSRGDLAEHAQSLLVEFLGALKLGVADSIGGSNLIGDRRVGRSADGWRYLELNGMVTPGGAGRARIMLIDRGATVVPIIAMSEPSNGCVGLSIETTPNTNTITWVALYHSLRLLGATPSDHVRGQIIGRWENFGMSAAGAGALRNEVYAPNGRYGSSLATTATGRELSSNGDGKYVIDADTLAIYPNAGTPEAQLIRIVEDYEANVPSKSTVRLCKLKVDVAGPYELCLSRLAN